MFFFKKSEKIPSGINLYNEFFLVVKYVIEIC